MKRVIAAPAAAAVIAAAAWGGPLAACDNAETEEERCDSIARADEAESLRAKLQADSVAAARADSLIRYERLSEEDFQLVAEELDVEVAAMKAVVLIEAGSEMKGFWKPGVPVINFDRTMYNKYARTAPDRSPDKGAKVPEGLKGYALQEWTYLTNARKSNAQGADMGTFWGMFQIGGFNYKICGCATVKEFVDKMSYSELSQLELFAKFLINTGMVKYLREKNWSAFARAYNGASYAKRGYHTKMAAAYRKFSK